MGTCQTDTTGWMLTWAYVRHYRVDVDGHMSNRHYRMDVDGHMSDTTGWMLMGTCQTLHGGC